MAGKSLGTLTIDLVAKVDGFVSGLDQFERVSQKWRKQVQSDVKAAATALTAFAATASAAAIGVGVADYNLLKTTSKQITETDHWTKSLNMSTQFLLAWQYTAEKVRVSGDQMTDIFKDIGDKIDDAILDKSGEAVSALDVLGLSAKRPASESPDKQLLATGDALGKTKTNAKKTTILENLGNDLSKPLPLLGQGEERLRRYMGAAEQSGVAPDDADIEKLVKVNSFSEDMETQVNGVKIEIATGLVNVDLPGLQNAITDMGDVFKDPQVIQGLTGLVGDVVDFATWLVKVSAETGKLIDLYRDNKAIDDNTSVTDIERRLSNLKVDVEDQGFPTSFNRIGMDVDGKRAEIAQLECQLSIMKTGNNLSLAQATIAAPSSSRNNYSLSTGETNGKSSPDAGTKKLESAFKFLGMSYQRQITLIDTTGKENQQVTKLERLHFDFTSGRLTGINAAQKERLEQLATEINRLNSLKKTNEKNLKLVGFTASLRKQNQNEQASDDSDFISAGMGDKNRQYMEELLDIQCDFLDRQADLQKQYQSGNISKSLYGQEMAALQQALDERLDVQEDYYKKFDAQMDDWQSKMVDTLNDYVDNSADYYQTTANAITSILGKAASVISNNLNDPVHGVEDLGDFFSNIFSDLGETIIKTLSDMATQWLVYRVVQLLAGKSTQADAVTPMLANTQASSLQARVAAYASAAAAPIVDSAFALTVMATTAAVTAPLVAVVGTPALTDMAHDGADNVPEAGAWLLQKGERVVTPQTSAKLDETLDRVNQQSAQGASFSPIINVNASDDPFDTQITMTKQATAEGAKLGYQQATSDLVNGKGSISKAMMCWNTNRRTG